MTKQASKRSLLSPSLLHLAPPFPFKGTATLRVQSQCRIPSTSVHPQGASKMGVLLTPMDALLLCCLLQWVCYFYATYTNGCATSCSRDNPVLFYVGHFSQSSIKISRRIAL